MFRVSQFMQEIAAPTPLGPGAHAARAGGDLEPGPALQSHLQALLLDLGRRRLSGRARDGRGLLGDGRPEGLPGAGADPVGRRAAAAPRSLRHRASAPRRMGFYVGLSTNGTLIDGANIDRIADRRLRLRRHQPRRHRGDARPLPPQRRRVRRLAGGHPRCAATPASRSGVRFTMTADNDADLPALLATDRGRGRRQVLPVAPQLRRPRQHEPRDDARLRDDAASDGPALRRAWDCDAARHRAGIRHRQQRRRRRRTCCIGCARAFRDARGAHRGAKLAQWGGNASGVNVANIDNVGNVHPDTMLVALHLGNVRERPFSEIWRTSPIRSWPV